MNLFGRIFSAFGRTRIGGWTIRNVVTPLDRKLYRWTSGRITISAMAFPTLLLVTVGRKSGKERITPLIYLRDGEKLLVGSSNVGLEQSAAWPLNIAANPAVRVQIGKSVRPYLARAGTSEEVDHYWPKFAAIYPPFATYAERSGVRKLFILEPAHET
ncbi:MAG: nitroreductase family deazaflavin-dependent oxidoreductase [Candidatus Viridilinea halotolerans]|uniref:Nitroreductase family deazaflavin-dependent oxidoreductase n=1 Tax=Candidatus Viridilinea halotolerans TaxID=2491704 RepID=A0A426TZC1_9CHLR|nr:MAG: nitroreductase family deazaflavin-dependent oxidoreductase [Candidatus Viridilinea halotolerans]